MRMLRSEPGVGPGWSKVITAMAEGVGPTAICRIWVFPPLRREDREWGTAVVARCAGDDRLAVITARYMILTRGKQKGQGRVEVTEVAESPESVVLDVVHNVQRRTGETEAPVEIDPELWFPKDHDEPAA